MNNDSFILVFGSSGMLGNYLVRYLTSKNKLVISVDRDKINVSSVTYETLFQFISNFDKNKLKCIVNCIGVIPQRGNDEIKNYICWGTTDDYETYIYWRNFFDKCNWHIYKKINDIIKYIYCIEYI